MYSSFTALSHLSFGSVRTKSIEKWEEKVAMHWASLYCNLLEIFKFLDEQLFHTILHFKYAIILIFKSKSISFNIWLLLVLTGNVQRTDPVIEPVGWVGRWVNRSDRLNRSLTGWPGLSLNQVEPPWPGIFKKKSYIFVIIFKKNNLTKLYVLC